MKKGKSLLATFLGALLAGSSAQAAVVTIGFDQFSRVYINSDKNGTGDFINALASGSYFAFGSFNGSFDPTTVNSSNLLSTLRGANWFKSFDVAFVNSDFHQYLVATAESGVSALTQTLS